MSTFTETTEPPAKPEKPQKTTKRIEKLLADFKKFDGELAHHKELGPRYKKAKDELLPTLKLDDAESVRKLSDLNLRLDMLPAITNQFQEAADTAKADLADECRLITQTLLGAIDNKFSTLRQQMTGALEPFYPKPDKSSTQAEQVISSVTFGAVYDVEHAVAEICAVTIPGSTLVKIRERLRGTNFIERDVFKKAAELIEYGAIIDALKIVDNAKV